MIKTILFDVGGVLVRKVDFRLLAPKIAQEVSVDDDSFFRFHKRYWKRLRTGKITMTQFCTLAKKKFHIRMPLLSIWNRTVLNNTVINTELLKMIKRIRNRYKVGVITNVDEWSVRLNTKRGIYKPFYAKFLSCKMGCAKPHRTIFSRALKKLKVKASEILVIDDYEKNLIAPHNMGMKVIHFRNNRQLLHDFAIFGIEV